MMRDARVLQIYEGTNEIKKDSYCTIDPKITISVLSELVHKIPRRNRNRHKMMEKNRGGEVMNSMQGWGLSPEKSDSNDFFMKPQ
jgi:hypothetical protein